MYHFVFPRHFWSLCTFSTHLSIHVFCRILKTQVEPNERRKTVINCSHSREHDCMTKFCIAICFTLNMVNFVAYLIFFIKLIRRRLIIFLTSLSFHCVKSVPIRSFFWSRKNSVFGHFSRSVQFFNQYVLSN